MNDALYRALEERFRGSRSLVKERLAVYLPYLSVAAAAHPGLAVFDIGCGRGEWLELLRERGIPATGMDLSARMVEECRCYGLRAVQGDAIEALRALPAGSLLAVSAFHVVEHLSFAALETLLTEARRALAPEGLLLLETPNPENLCVGAANFYLDPSHRRPLPAPLLAFLVEYHGFSSILVLRLQEDRRLHATRDVMLHDVLAGVSPDYAIIASATTLPAVMRADGGMSLPDIAQRYDACLAERTAAVRREAEQRATRIESRLAGAISEIARVVELAAQAQAKAAEAQASVAEAQASAAEAQASAAEAQASAAEAEAAAERLRMRLEAILASRSWRLTRPLRRLARLLRSWPRHG